MFKFEMEGFDELIEELEGMEQKAEELEKGQNVSFEELFSPAFMKKYTQFETIQEMLDASEFKIESEEDFENIPEDEWNDFVNESTSFRTWEEMTGKAGQLWTAKQLGFE